MPQLNGPVPPADVRRSAGLPSPIASAADNQRWWTHHSPQSPFSVLNVRIAYHQSLGEPLARTGRHAKVAKSGFREQLHIRINVAEKREPVERPHACKPLYYRGGTCWRTL